MTDKETVAELVSHLPDNCTLEDIEYQVHALNEIRLGEKDIANGKVSSHSDVLESLKHWL